MLLTNISRSLPVLPGIKKEFSHWNILLEYATFKFALLEKLCHFGLEVVIWGYELRVKTDGVKALQGICVKTQCRTRRPGILGHHSHTHEHMLAKYFEASGVSLQLVL